MAPVVPPVGFSAVGGVTTKVRFFAQNRSRKYRQKVTATTLSPTVPHPNFQLLAQMARVCFHGRKRVHTRLRQQDPTQRLTRRNRGRFGWGWYHYSRSVPHVHQHPRAGYQNGVFCRFWALAGCAPEERREPAGQRCDYARRCSEASRPHWAALLGWKDLTRRSGRVTITRNDRTASRLALVQRLRWAVK